MQKEKPALRRERVFKVFDFDDFPVALRTLEERKLNPAEDTYWMPECLKG